MLGNARGTLKYRGRNAGPTMETFCQKTRKVYNDLQEYGEPTSPHTATTEFLAAIQDSELDAAKAMLRTIRPWSIDDTIQQIIER
jgi:hypothetical protein